MEETLAEIQSNKSFDALVKAVSSEKEKKAGLQQTILKYVKLIDLLPFNFSPIFS